MVSGSCDGSALFCPEAQLACTFDSFLQLFGRDLSICLEKIYKYKDFKLFVVEDVRHQSTI